MASLLFGSRCEASSPERALSERYPRRQGDHIVNVPQARVSRQSVPGATASRSQKVRGRFLRGKTSVQEYKSRTKKRKRLETSPTGLSRVLLFLF